MLADLFLDATCKYVRRFVPFMDILSSIVVATNLSLTQHSIVLQLKRLLICGCNNFTCFYIHVFSIAAYVFKIIIFNLAFLKLQITSYLSVNVFDVIEEKSVQCPDLFV